MNIRDYKKPLPRKRTVSNLGSKYSKIIFILIFAILFVYTLGKLLKLNLNGTNTYHRENVQISGNKLTATKTIMQICGFDSNEDVTVEIDPNKISQKIMELDFIKGVSITFRPPRILNITVEERQPVAFVYGRGLNLIDTEGFLMPIPETNTSWDIPLISGIQENLGKLGEQATAKDVYLALAIVNYLETEHPLLAGLVSEINLAADDYVEIYLVHGGAKIRTNKNSFYKELYILKTYLANYYDWHQLRQTEYIDLRFADQIIVKAKV
jgi:cell division septal protein FtsQ